ncbi:helix-turn-helix domain-containing protein [Bifidobacterium asteroides]|uniref:Helix-turn-helix domain-containing protein n=1 Tax=Bifidobacterium asteroides TaxID=1684 RepID=A0ABS3IWH2_9BIFI|nr:helix-turn-helix domain-containing protein [Bifidobacterium asteroides]MCP8615194.1 helix-turn-helix domain-containing protein [Bifidobacterium asteroides]
MSNFNDTSPSNNDKAQEETGQITGSAITDLPILASPNQVSEYTGVPVNTLAYWRFEGSHIPFVKMGRLIRYRKQDILNFINGNVYTSTAEAKAAE